MYKIKCIDKVDSFLQLGKEAEKWEVAADEY
jgi:hypothetical protein